jgi:hypothetical protein
VRVVDGWMDVSFAINSRVLLSHNSRVHLSCTFRCTNHTLYLVKGPDNVLTHLAHFLMPPKINNENK